MVLLLSCIPAGFMVANAASNESSASLGLKAHHLHSYTAATCTTAKRCKICKLTVGSPLGHYYTSNCDSTCERCYKKTRVAPHSMSLATCTAPAKCYNCGLIKGKALGHKYTDACDKYCNRCAEKRIAPHRCKPLRIVSQPKTVYAEEGTYAKTTVTARGEGLRYTWYVKDKGDRRYFVSSQKTNTYKLKMSDENNNRIAYCVITDKHGIKVTTKKVFLRMEVAITEQPEHAYAKENAYAKTTVTATGVGLKYAWYVMDNDDTKFFLSSQKTNTYKVKITDETNNRKAYCVITDIYGNEITTKPVYLRMKGTITQQPTTVYAEKGTNAKTTVTAIGKGLKYTWYVKDIGDTKFYRSSQKTNTYKLKISAANNDRKAYCVITDAYGNKTRSETVSLRMKVSITSEPKTSKVKKNAYAKTTVKASGLGLRYVWYYKNAGSSKYVKDSSQKTNTYKVKMTSKVDGRKVICYVYDTYGNRVQTNAATLKMK